MVHKANKGLTGGTLGGVRRATPSYTVNTSNGGKPERYQNDGWRFRVHCCVVCNLDDQLSLLRGMTDDHTLTYFLFFSLFLPLFRFRFGYRLFHPVFFFWVICCLLGFGFCLDSFSVWCIYIPRFYFSEVYDPFSVIACIPFCFCFVFAPEVIFRYRVVGACRVTTYCSVAISWCSNNISSNDRRHTILINHWIADWPH